MSNSYYAAGSIPPTYGPVTSQELRDEFARIEAAFNRLPEPISSSGGGFTGGSFANANLNNPTISGGSIGFNGSSSIARLRYLEIPESTSVFDLDHAETAPSYAKLFLSNAADNDLSINTLVLGYKLGRLGLTEEGDVFAGGDPKAPLATTATKGFLYIPMCAGAPTGTPSLGLTGHVPLVYDSSNNRLYLYDGGWRYAATT